LFDVILTGLLVGSSALTEFAALFGVRQGGLTPHDRRLISLLFAVTGLVTMVRVLAPVARTYATGTRVPESRVWLWLTITTVASFIGLLFLLN
jgi:hypothetical protein